MEEHVSRLAGIVTSVIAHMDIVAKTVQTVSKPMVSEIQAYA